MTNLNLGILIWAERSYFHPTPFLAILSNNFFHPDHASLSLLSSHWQLAFLSFFLAFVTFFHNFIISSPVPFSYVLPFDFSLSCCSLLLLFFLPSPVPWLGSCDVCHFPHCLPICRSSFILASGPYPLTAGSCWVADASLTHIPLLGVCNDHGKTYALYTLTVFRKNPDGSEDTWKTYRRYSDFHDFHMRITEQVK